MIVISEIKNSASFNMNSDQLLMELIHEYKSPFFRVYQWDKPTISLGYMQKANDILNLKIKMISMRNYILNDKN